MNLNRHQLHRLYRIDAALQRDEFPSGPALAKALGVSRGTIHRDLQILREAFRAPITFDPSRGGYAYGRAFSPELPDMPTEEAIELARGLFRRGDAVQGALGETLVRRLQQLSRVLPEEAAAVPPAPSTHPPLRRTRPQAHASPVATVRIRFDRTVTPEILEAGFFRRGELQLLTNGGSEASVEVADADAFLLDLLRWAPHFEIAGPPWVRRRLPLLLRRLLKQVGARQKPGRKR